MQTSLGLAWKENLPAACHEIHTERETPIHHGARRLLEVWAARQAQGAFVIGRDVPSRDLARVMSGLVLYQPILNGDFRVRLAGVALRRRFGRDVTGDKLSEMLNAPQFAERSRRFRQLLESGKPLVLEVRLCGEDGRTLQCFELVALRVLAPDGRTPWVMSGMFFHDWRL